MPIIVKDDTGRMFTVSERIRAKTHPECGIRPGYSQINLNDNTLAITILDDLADLWLAGEIRVRVFN